MIGGPGTFNKHHYMDTILLKIVLKATKKQKYFQCLVHNHCRLVFK